LHENAFGEVLDPVGFGGVQKRQKIMESFIIRDLLQPNFSNQISSIFDGYRSGALRIPEFRANTRNPFLVNTSKVTYNRKIFMVRPQISTILQVNRRP
jgi:hypothetical protein